MISKTCNRCHTDQPLSEFPNCKLKKDGKLNQCKTCRRALPSNDPEKAMLRARKWYADAENAARARVKNAAWAAKNPDRFQSYRRKWKATSPRYRTILAIANAKRRSVPGSHTRDDLEVLRRRQKDRCAYCRVRLNGRGQLDHVLPVAKGGTNDRSNLCWACGTCNRRKADKHPIVFAQQRGLLL